MTNNFTMYQKHGLIRHPLYNVWRAMISRCYDPNNRGYKDYGGRGITVGPEWSRSFITFYTDMSPTWQRGLYLERRNNNKGYTRTNCYWATVFQQNQNKRNNVLLNTPWGKLCLAEAARRAGIHIRTLRIRMARWPKKHWLLPPDATRRIAKKKPQK